MSSSFDRFELVGYRFRNLTIDEAFFESDEPRVSLEIGVEPQVEISDQKMKDRPVIELTVIVFVSLGKGAVPFIKAQCTAGFVGRRPEDDGNVALFAESKEQFTRAIYWLVRQRIVSLLTMTKFRAVPFPWDTKEENIVTADRARTKAVARKGIRKAVAKKSS